MNKLLETRDDATKDKEIYALLRPYVAEWFKRSFKSFTEPQRKSIPLIKQGYNVLISSPTGTGKTLAAFLGIIDDLYSIGEQKGLEDKIYAVYVSPLRALNNDMKRNLFEPLQEITNVAKEMGKEIPDIRIAVRTSDTSPSERQAMLRRPPHILITTPESLSIILVAPRFREKLKRVKWIIVDEIHELALSKRGTNLSLLIERLEWLVQNELQRIGLSATIAPLDRIARFLGGYYDNGVPRPVKIVDARFKKPIDIKVLTPAKDLVYTGSEELNEGIYKILAELIKTHRSTLVFTNTRSATERVVYKLKKILAEEKLVSMDEIEAHHSSLSRNLRLEVEKKLKKGELKVVVSSTSLEMGIDIGYIDLVVLLSSPKSVSRLLQRVGRAGHRLHEVSKGRIIVVDRDDLVECTVLADAARKRLIDKAKIPRNPLDVLAQNIVAMSLEQKWSVDDAYRIIKRSYPYHSLPKKDFLKLLEFLGGKNTGLEELKVYRKIWYDPQEGVFGRKKGARMIYYLNQGTIPDEAKIRVFLKNKKYIGDLEEGFVQILSPGDIFVLGGKTYRFVRSLGARIIVEPAEGLRPTVPSWFSEMLPLAFDSALLVGSFRKKVLDEIVKNKRITSELVEKLSREYLIEEKAAWEILRYIYEQYMFTKGIVANNRLIHIEIYDDEVSRNIIFHSLYGRRTNDALSRAYASIITNMYDLPVRITVSDNAFMLTLAGHPDIDVDRIVERVNSKNISSILEKALWNTELMRRRFRHCAQRSFMILRNYKGWEKTPHRMQLNAQMLLSALKEEPGHPIIKETLREIMEDYMDLESAKKILRGIERGDIKIVITPPNRIPSPFAHHIISIGYHDIVLMEDKRRLLMRLHRKVMEYLGKKGSVTGGDGG